MRLSLLLGSMLGVALTLGGGSAAADPNAIRDFVRLTFIEGAPFTEVAKLAPDQALPVLLEMLANQREEAHLPNIVVTLGMLGDDRAVPPLLDFITAGNRARLAPARTTAKTSAVMALG